MIQIRPVSWLDAWKGEAAGFSGQQEDSMLAAKKWPCSSGTGEEFFAVRSGFFRS